MGLGDGVITVALAAFGPIMAIESLFVFAAVEQTRVGRMTHTTTLAHLRDARRTGRVVAVTGVTRGRAQIALPQQRLAMHALAIFRQLSARQRRTIGPLNPAMIFASAWHAPQVSDAVRIDLIADLGRTNAMTP